MCARTWTRQLMCHQNHRHPRLNRPPHSISLPLSPFLCSSSKQLCASFSSSSTRLRIVVRGKQNRNLMKQLLWGTSPQQSMWSPRCLPRWSWGFWTVVRRNRCSHLVYRWTSVWVQLDLTYSQSLASSRRSHPSVLGSPFPLCKNRLPAGTSFTSAPAIRSGRYPRASSRLPRVDQEVRTSSPLAYRGLCCRSKSRTFLKLFCLFVRCTKLSFPHENFTYPTRTPYLHPNPVVARSESTPSLSPC